ncbi:hypothetical protein I4U23_006244 [Adineta vaga]|nr:hypothetical protein I4U23_006244 [Adineta vaga]
MQQVLNLNQIVFLLFLNIIYVSTDILYQCNFDDGMILHHCFTSPITISSHVGTADFLEPNAPLSDVTSTSKPTESGEVCQLPYTIFDYKWKMYFCNDGYCPTKNDSNSLCQHGRFGYIQLFDTAIESFQLDTRTNGINGTDQQCLIYYYYMSPIGDKNITIIKEEKGNKEEIIDSVSDTPFNGWIERRVSYFIKIPNYKIYFLVQKSSISHTPYIAFDEISIHEGSCDDQSITTTQSIITSSETTTQIITSTDSLISSTQTELISTISSSSSITTPTEHSSTKSTIDHASSDSTTVQVTNTTSHNSVVSSYTRVLPYKTHDTIILSVIIPLVWIVFIVVIIWIKRSTHTSNNVSKLDGNNRLSSNFELSNVSCD